MNGLLTFYSKLEYTHHGNGEGENIADRANGGRDREIQPATFIHKYRSEG